MSHPNFIDLVAGILEWDNKHVMIASAYFHHDRDVVIPELVELIDFCNSKNMALISCADTMHGHTCGGLMKKTQEE